MRCQERRRYPCTVHRTPPVRPTPQSRPILVKEKSLPTSHLAMSPPSARSASRLPVSPTPAPTPVSPNPDLQVRAVDERGRHHGRAVDGTPETGYGRRCDRAGSYVATPVRGEPSSTRFRAASTHAEEPVSRGDGALLAPPRRGSSLSPPDPAAIGRGCRGRQSRLAGGRRLATGWWGFPSRLHGSL